MNRHKLSASALAAFLKSPKAYYWRYIARLEPLQPSVVTFDHDKLFGILWAQYVDRFYKGVAEEKNTRQTLQAWLEQTEGWVPDRAREAKTKALESLMPQYYQMFSPDDGCRNPAKSELWLEDETFCGRLDGLSDAGIIHEVKSTSRCPQLAEQLWKVQNSIQVKLYCVLADAAGHCIEFAFKDSPYQVFRGPITPVTGEQKREWRQELEIMAAKIYALGDDPHNYPCHTDGCCMTTKNMVSMCSFQALCDQGLNDTTKIAYKTKIRTS